MMRTLLLLVLASSVASCGLLGLRNPAKSAESEVALPFKAKLSRGDGRAFSVAVSHKGNGLEEVRESVRFEATKYCLLTFGGSDADWKIDPATDDWAFVQDGDKLIFEGECTAL